MSVKGTLQIDANGFSKAFPSLRLKRGVQVTAWPTNSGRVQIGTSNANGVSLAPVSVATPGSTSQAFFPCEDMGYLTLSGAPNDSISYEAF